MVPEHSGESRETNADADREDAAIFVGPNKSNVLEAADRYHYYRPVDDSGFAPWRALHLAITDRDANNNLIRLVIYGTIILISIVSFGLGTHAYLNEKSSDKTRERATSIMALVLSGLFGLGAGAGIH